MSHVCYRKKVLNCECSILPLLFAFFCECSATYLSHVYYQYLIFIYWVEAKRNTWLHAVLNLVSRTPHTEMHLARLKQPPDFTKSPCTYSAKYRCFAKYRHKDLASIITQSNHHSFLPSSTYISQILFSRSADMLTCFILYSVCQRDVYIGHWLQRVSQD